MVRAILRLGHLMPGKPMGRNRAMSIGFAMTANGGSKCEELTVSKSGPLRPH
jgi:hypothetical protein